MINWEKEAAKVVLKFQYGKRGSINTIVSKTMGRIAVISHAYQGAMPQPGTFWLCRVDKEINMGKANGCFIITPLEHVPIEQIMKLVPGAYDTEVHGTNVVCRPKVKGHYWIIPFSLKKYFLKKDKAEIQYQAVIVPLP